MKRIAAAVTIALCTASLFAGVSKSYKDWPKTPIGYYMTSDERRQWNALQSDRDAEQFIKDFVARRGGETFTREVAKNAENADKYLTIGKTPVANVQWTGDGAAWVFLQGNVATCTQPAPVIILPVFSTATATVKVSGNTYLGNSGLYCL